MITCFDGFVDGVFSPMREHTDSYGSSAMSPLDSLSRQSAGTIGISNITPLRSDLSSLKNVCYLSVWTLAKLYQNFAFSKIRLKISMLLNVKVCFLQHNGSLGLSPVSGPYTGSTDDYMTEHNPTSQTPDSHYRESAESPESHTSPVLHRDSGNGQLSSQQSKHRKPSHQRSWIKLILYCD